MTRHPHLYISGSHTAIDYKYTGEARGKFKTPPRDDRSHHGKVLAHQYKIAMEQGLVEVSSIAEAEKPEGLVFEFESEPDFDLKLESLEVTRSGIELRSVRMHGNSTLATVFVPISKLEHFTKVFEAYITKHAVPKAHSKKPLVDSIRAIRLAALESFWTDSNHPFPAGSKPTWWEVWLSARSKLAVLLDEFRQEAGNKGLMVPKSSLSFPERKVVLVRGTAEQMSSFRGIFDALAELRKPKVVTDDYLRLQPRDQGKLIEETLTRIVPPKTGVPAVCLLDTGVNRGHPLLGLALHEDHVLSVDPNWDSADLNGHGTELAGVALYGCLTELFANNDKVKLTHRLESVKLLPDKGSNDPDLYGALTAEAVARAETVSPDRKRAVCMAVTSDPLDEGSPTSWSAEIDQLCSGALDDERRLMFVSAGNTSKEDRKDYPNTNHTRGIEDPAQAWNAVTVGAFTERTTINSNDFQGWEPIAESGELSPSSRTSLIWNDKSWPLKPDIVMEGGNDAINRSSGKVDSPDDLLLLTTSHQIVGKLLTSTGETSGATALAARFGAILQAAYPTLWPETIRGLLIHSARWTKPMLDRFPYKQRHNRLRCYGYGVPSLERAIWSASNHATLVMEESVQPFHRVKSAVKAKHMNLHALPWPKDVLEAMGDDQVRLRVTLSYFVEPSPGHRGWTRKTRYQSFGLRFEVRRPTETLKQFKQRMTRSAWDDEERPDNVSEEQNWEIGPNLRTKGSVHSDCWTGTASELAASGYVAVLPVSGWWRERPHLGRVERSARYSLIVSLESNRTDIDLYVPIKQLIKTPIEIMT